MMDSPPPHRQEDLVLNFKGVAFAAFAPVETIERMLGCSNFEATEFQTRAAIDFMRMMRGAGRA